MSRSRARAETVTLAQSANVRLNPRSELFATNRATRDRKNDTFLFVDRCGQLESVQNELAPVKGLQWLCDGGLQAGAVPNTGGAARLLDYSRMELDHLFELEIPH